MRALGTRPTAAAFVVTTFLACQSASPNPPTDSPTGSIEEPEPAPSIEPSPAPPTPKPDAAPEPEPEPEPDVSITKETMTFGGRTRSYLLAMPRDDDARKRYPLVLSFHGNPGTAEGMASLLPFEAASKREAVIAYPQAETGDWDLYTPTDDNRDMSWIRALVGEIATKANIDEASVFGFGYSGGAFFITQMACRFAGFFKAISVNAGGGPSEARMGYAKRANGCYVCPGGPIPTLVTHGDADTAVEPDSGEFTSRCFASTNGCEATRSPASPSPCEQHDACPAEHPVKFCLIPGLGHTPWPAVIDEAWAFFSGR